jgi:hypothetical protein
MSLRIQAQPPVPCSENGLATMPAMIGAPSSSWITVSPEAENQPRLGRESYVVRARSVVVLRRAP